MDLRPFETVEPVHMQWNSDGSVAIVWDDAHESTYALPFLREKCPCATCRGTHGPPTTLVRTNKAGFNIVSGPVGSGGRSSPVAAEVKQVVPVGQYAIRFTWGDGHDSGLYSYRYLRSICPCPECETARTAQA